MHAARMLPAFGHWRLKKFATCGIGTCRATRWQRYARAKFVCPAAAHAESTKLTTEIPCDMGLRATTVSLPIISHRATNCRYGTRKMLQKHVGGCEDESKR